MAARFLPRVLVHALNRRDPRPPGFRARPERVVLEPRGVGDQNAKPPVRIFVGTEPSQFRAERVLIWSIEQARDPSRTYEIHFMKDLAGFDRRRWLTGFTNYRFAIPHFAGCSGRAIYNDVDQIYLTDPAELFDLDMGPHGYLSITPRDTSVMLIDCERMSDLWPLEAAQHERRKRIEARTREIPELWGPLAGEWNSRDQEYVAGRSKVLHYTTIHAQPWQPFPERFVYQPNPVGYVWHDMEKAADRAGFRVFTVDQPSHLYRELVTRAGNGSAGASSALRPSGTLPAPDGLEELLTRAESTSVLDYRIGHCSSRAGVVPESKARTVTRFDAAGSRFAKEPVKGFDAAVSAGGLEYLPDEDVPWAVDLLFRYARRVVYVQIEQSPAPIVLPAGPPVNGQARSAPWWIAQLEAAASQHPEVHWKLVLCDDTSLGRKQTRFRDGGPPLGGRLPRVWILADDKAGHTTQSVGLADALGWPYEIKHLRFNPLNRLSNRLLGASLLGVDRGGSDALSPPWPDLVISTGRRSAPVARWIGEQSRGQTRLVQLGRKGGEDVDAFDLVVSCAHFRAPLHPRRMEIVAPLSAVTPERMGEAAARWKGIFGDAPRPHVVLVVGGTSAMHELDAVTAGRMADEVRGFTAAAGGTLFAITSPRTGREATEALRAGLGKGPRLHVWQKGEKENPYLGHLALADALVVTGESESMLSEAVAAGKPLFIYPLPEKNPGPRRRLGEWVVRRASVQRRKEKGTIRPQQGLEYLAARLIERGLVRPPRDLRQLHQALIGKGVARSFGAPLDGWTARPLSEAEEVAHRVRALFGFDGHPLADAPPRERRAGATAP